MEQFNAFPADDSYAYEPLGHGRAIRLLQIMPDATEPHGFSLTLQTMDLDDEPLFCALSYTWKSAIVSGLEHDNDDYQPPTVVTILCDGKKLAINENAFDFLRQALIDRLFLAAYDGEDEDLPGLFRLTDYQTRGQDGDIPRRLWIDSISINQKDVTERSRQVSLMGDIYQNSANTIIWLGKEDPHPGARWVMQTFLPRFLRLLDEEGQHYFKRKDPACVDHGLVRHFGEEICARWREEQRNFFVFLIQRRWFCRGWVVQEVILKALEDSDSVVLRCGSFIILWDDLLHFLAAMTKTDWRRTITKRLRSHPETAQYGPRFSQVLQRLVLINSTLRLIMVCYRGETHNWLSQDFGPMTDTERFYTIFFETVHKMRGCEFTERKDHFYGCLGLVSRVLDSEYSSTPMTPDYSLSDVDVYIDAAWAMVKHMPYLTLLGDIEDTGMRNFHELPSWVPDFTVT